MISHPPIWVGGGQLANSSRLRPFHVLKVGVIPLPEVNAVMMRAGHNTHAIGFVAKARMLQPAANEERAFLRGRIEPRQRIGPVAPPAFEEMLVAREQGWLLEVVKQRHDVVIANAQVREIQSDHAAANAPCVQNVPLFKRDVLMQQVHAAGGYRGTIGVVTPFRQQMIRIRDILEAGDSLTPDFMERVRFLAATAHGFQGDERDLILFSLCVGPDMTEGATIFLRENPNLFNVAVSRARAVLHVVGNRDWALNCGVSFIEKLARRTMPGTAAARTNPRDPYQSPWEKVLADALTQAGVKVIPQYPIAGRFLDLAVLNPIKIDVEVDGESVHRTAGGGRKDDDHWRDLQLQSLGWKVCRFWVYELRKDLQRCVQKVINALKD